MPTIININNANYNLRKTKVYTKTFIIVCIFSALFTLKYEFNKEKVSFDLFGLNQTYKTEHSNFKKGHKLNDFINKENKKYEYEEDYIYSCEKLIPLFLIILILFYRVAIPKRIFINLLFADCFNNYCFCAHIRTGLYGGSFNPIHNGHIALTRQILDAGLMDEVWFVVSPLNPFKKEKSDLLSDELRLEMTSLALEGEPNMMAQDFEFHLPKPSYTWQTLQEMSKEYPNREFILLLGLIIGSFSTFGLIIKK